MKALAMDKWSQGVIREEEYRGYLHKGKDFIDEECIQRHLEEQKNPDVQQIRSILAKSLSLQRLDPAETAALLNLQDENLWQEVFDFAGKVKNRVYGPRVVTFAPLYLSNLCVNNCSYCAFRTGNRAVIRRRLSLEEVREETRALVSCGHKRLIVVYGEHPESNVDYIADTVRVIYDTRVDRGEIRRVNINAAPLGKNDYGLLKEVGIGTYQVFQETYHHRTYRQVHHGGIKSSYPWRLYALHRAQEAGVDDVGIGALFGLHDWRFEVMGLLCHVIDLEEKFGGVGPHTISFPRIEPAANTPLSLRCPQPVDDRDFLRLVAVLRLSVPYTGLIVTAREPAAIRKACLQIGCTQTDASSRIGIGAYAETGSTQRAERQQFLLGDPRSLDQLVREIAELGFLTSFCTAGYRCGRTGIHFMELAKTGKVNRFCIPNAILTFQEYLIDYASEETRRIGEGLIRRRIKDVPGSIRGVLEARLRRIENGERDIWF